MKLIIKKNRPKWQIPLQVILLIALLIFIVIMFKPKKEVVEHPVSQVIFVEDEVARDGAIVTVNGILSITEGYHWINDHLFGFTGTHTKKGTGDFNIDLQNLSLLRDVNLEHEEALTLTLKNGVAHDVKNLYQDNQYQLVYVKDEALRGIYQIKDGVITNVSFRMALNSILEPYYLVSENGQKFVYFEEGTGRIVTYDFKTGKKKIIQKPLTYDELEQIEQYVVVSPKGGYIMLREDDGLIYVYGADSANVYVNGIEGVMPTFSKNDGFLYYYYEGALTSDYTGTQLGMVDLSTGDITYDTAEGEDTYLTTLLPVADSDAVYYLNGYAEGETFTIDSIESYDPETHQKTTSRVLEGTQIALASELYISDEILLIDYGKDEIILSDLRDQNVKTLASLEPFNLDGVQKLYYPYADGYIVHYGGALYRYNHLGSTKLIAYEGTLHDVMISPSFKKIAIFFEDKSSAYKLVFSDKLTENY